MGVKCTAAIGFGIIIKGDDMDTIERVNKFCGDSENLLESVKDVLEISGSEYLVADMTGNTLLGYEAQDVVVIVADTYRDFDIMSSGFAGVFRIDTDYVIPEGTEELHAFCEKIGLETTASWLAWNNAT
jgi:hypothetical protein